MSFDTATYTYDANGNMTQRVENGLTYTQTFDAENRLISVTVNSQTTQFIYDGDGNLVKKINPDNSRTIYIASMYEVDKNSGGTVTRNVTYYPMAGAMRINVIGGSNTVYYLLKDHLGSASTITDMNGNILGELRYFPYGETRLATGSILIDKLFTGQREIVGLGIYHYNARFYSQKLGRFLSADTIIPSFANPQSLNRYMYVLGNPVRYIDPTGHLSCSNANAAEGNCEDRDFWTAVEEDYGITFTGNWTKKNKRAVYDAVRKVGVALSQELDKDVGESFKQIFGTTTFEWGCPECTKLGRTVDDDTIKFRGFYGDYNSQQTLMNINLVIHEIAHMFENVIAYDLPDGKEYKPARSALTSNLTSNREGLGAQWIYQQSSDISSGEIFADMFVGWVQDAWAYNIDGSLTDKAGDRRDWMNQNMPTFIDMVP